MAKLPLVLVLSLLLHAALLFWLPGRRSPPDAPLPLLVSLQPAAAGTSASARAPATPPAVPARPSPSTPRPAGQVTAPALVAASTATPLAGAPANVAPAPAASVTAVAAVAPESAGGGVQDELLAAYRQQLSELFARHQEYPRVAALRGWEGEVRVRLRIARKGNLIDVQLDQSSGHGVLDEHALAMIGEFPALPALPPALASREIQVVVPINYRLRKTI